MAELADKLGALAASGRTVTFHAAGLEEALVRTQVAEVAAGPYAPLLAEAVAHAFEHADPQWAAVAKLFPVGFANQRSFLALAESLETLLGSAPAAQALGKPLNAALLDGLNEAVDELPLVAAARLEGAVRLAASNAVSPYRVWGTLDELPADGPEDFLERLPRILGVALDCWAEQEGNVGNTARDMLERLSVTESTDADALFELGCDRLRSALSSRDLPTASTRMSEARAFFASVDVAEEAREDAATYLAACEAVLGFTTGDTARVVRAADSIERALEQRTAWLHGTHQPTWMQPRLVTEAAWGRFLLLLRTGSQTLDEPVWMDSWQALDAVLAVYQAARTVRPVGSRGDAAGLAALVEPVIEDGFLREQSFMNALRRAAARPQDYPGPVFDTATATTIIERIDAREAKTEAAREHEEGEDEDSGREAAAERLHRLAPTVIQRLGFDRAMRLVKGLDDAAVSDVEGLAYASDVSRLKASDPLIIPLLERFIQELSDHPAFTGDVRHTFSVLVEQTLLFLKSRSDLTRTSLFGPGKKNDPPYDYRRKPGRGQRVAVEGDLQRDFHGWLMAGPLQSIVLVEPIDIGMGRADVMVHFGALRYLTEIKQDSADNTHAHIEAEYLTQETEYTNTNAPFGQLLVLDLTPKTHSEGTRRVDELAWIATHRPKGAETDRYVLAGIVTGNRITPSAYSR
ncbi:hypothetical protein [Actinomadura miaoliensis]|uniref:DUF3883 domain-containing protein n=1 Tax=Actinomadura miaoliensis TaxID=430685 RepID=A0ABP7VYY3_9ACTN